MKSDKTNIIGIRNLILQDRIMYCGHTRTSQREVRQSNCNKNWSLSYIITGGGKFTFDGLEIELKPGMVCQRLPGMKYRLEFYGGIPQYRYFIGLPRPGWEFMTSAHPGLSKEPVFDIGVDPNIIADIQSFLQKHGEMNEFSWTLAADLMELSETLLDPRKPDSTTVDHRIIKAKNILDDPKNLKLSLQEVASRAGLGYNNFRKLFTAELGTSPGDYRLNKRIEYAKQMLSSGNPQAETADALGFNDVYAFARQFKQRTGITPGKFIRSI